MMGKRKREMTTLLQPEGFPAQVRTDAKTLGEDFINMGWMVISPNALNIIENGFTGERLGIN